VAKNCGRPQISPQSDAISAASLDGGSTLGLVNETMATNFILRSPYLPANRSILRLDALSPLAWFQAIWPHLRNDADVTSKMLLGVEQLYGFDGFAEHVRNNEPAAPASLDELQRLLSQCWYSNNVECQDGYVLVETDDDEVELAFWWVSDEVFLAEQERFACYATDSLPLEIGEGGFDPECNTTVIGDAGGDGAVFAVFATVWDSGNLCDLPGPVEVKGLRLPDLAAWLQTAPGDEEHLLEIDWLALVARHNPKLDLPALLRRLAEACPQHVSNHWKEIHSGALSEEKLLKDVRWLGDGQPSVVVQDSPHAIEFRLYDGFNWNVWFLFDDLWASAHPTLAQSLLQFGTPIGNAG
jgi:hypothetical protein